MKLEDSSVDQVVIATAGHVDHGKTTLIKSLTGVDTDTTKEEKQRGLTINLGFTFFQLPNHQRVGIVDVPGHEKFLKNMLSGLSGIDLVLLVVDVNEGVMPQTREHAHILRLLGITNFIIVLTKVQTVDADMVELAVEDIRTTFAADPVLAAAPMVQTDAISNYGIEHLVQVIQQLVNHIPPRKNTGQARMNIDRSFTMKGFGTVVTGTLLEGSIHTGDSICLYPTQKTTQVKNIRTYDYATDIALPGQRTALNLTLPHDEIRRGDVIATADSVQVTEEFNAQLTTLALPQSVLKLNTRVRVYVGSMEVMGRLYPLGAEQIPAHATANVQIRLEKPVTIKYGDYFIIRSYSPITTLGGGQILDGAPPTRKRYDAAMLNTLKIRSQGQLPAILLDYCLGQSLYWFDPAAGAIAFNESSTEIQKAVQQLVQTKDLIALAGELLVAQNIDQAGQQIQTQLNHYHQQFPLRWGIPVSILTSRWTKDVGAKATKLIFQYLEQQQALAVTKGCYHLVSFQPQINSQDQQVQATIQAKLKAAGSKPPAIAELIAHQPNGQEVLNAMIGDSVVLLDNTTVMDQTVYQQLVAQVVDFLQRHHTMSLADYRDLTHSSRKYAMLVLERMDKDQITERWQNKRILKKSVINK